MSGLAVAMLLFGAVGLWGGLALCLSIAWKRRDVRS
ncbi:MetS family NSS transporter small subunit [Calditerricola satsumensis]|nr:MetS family NSS transporter small subunit [Calditerricola satsumensis]